ncbi:glycerol-3-phosphate-acyltransferase [Cristinia sonorae]|uniref:Glycerol-3-phosphate-acyltransferase n=1 Tax=Cristinia sonorae TaxID=1940300 RepID=A0A8K0UDD7_9AGAR|nr:glycerol-3-phosphate-acyltransferase [Cristinia sonorae]
MADAKVIHRIIRQLATWAVVSFFTEIRVIGGENVPKDGPLIVTATHHNMMLDPAILSSAFPYARILHYWVKATLFINPVATYILTSAGNIPVDRKSKDRQKLFKGTFKALSHNQAIALFPEGTSYTEPRIMQVKDGAAWAALEYTKWAAENGNKGAPVVIVPAAIVYTNKSKYRSNVIMEFGKPITMDQYKEEFMSSDEKAPRAAVKRLTAQIEKGLIESTINAPDWDTLYAARMARDLLWADEGSINLDEFVLISQTLVDLFSTPELVPNFNSIKRNLLSYYSLLQSTHLTNSVLSSLPLPRTLDPLRPIPLPSRLLTLSILVRDSLSSLVRLPLFVLPLLIHAPAYVVGKMAAKLVEDEEETQAQNKAVFGLFFVAVLVYPALFFFLWSCLRYTSTGALVAVGFLSLLAVYHNRLINDNYEHAKRLVAAWRVLVGVWTPKRWDLSVNAVAQYTIPKLPPENPWVDRSRSKSRPATPGTNTPTSSPLDGASGSNAPSSTAPLKKTKKDRRPPSRRLIRHVLRARIEAAKSLATLFDRLEQTPEKHVRASSHLARAFGGQLDPGQPEMVVTEEGVSLPEEPAGWRNAAEVLSFLRLRGAKIGGLYKTVEGEWAAALSSEGENEQDSNAGSGEDIVWVPSERQ